jgi:hypothetical protein
MSTGTPSPSNPRRCLNCESHVTRNFRQVHGDERNRAHRCRECDTYVNIVEGSAAGTEKNITDARRERGTRLNWGGDA